MTMVDQLVASDSSVPSSLSWPLDPPQAVPTPNVLKLGRSSPSNPMAVETSCTCDAQKVVAVLPDFKYSEALAQEDVFQVIRCQLTGLSTQTTEAKAAIQTDMEAARQQVQQAEAALEQVKESQRQGVSQLEVKVNTLIETQEQLQAAKDEKKKVKNENHDDILMGEKLREAKSKNVAIDEGAFCCLLNGSWTSTEERKEKLATLKEYLQEIGTEKTLVAAADGLMTKPEVRGDFDKMAIDSITEELRAKLKQVEEKLAERAPAERAVQAELLGLAALVDICQQKATAAEEQHKQVEVAVKGYTAEMKTCKQQLAKHSKELQGLTKKMETVENKAKTLEEASAALNRLVDAAKAAVEKAMEKAAKEAAEKEKEKDEKEAAKAEAKAEASEVVIAAEANPAEATEDLEPPAKRICTEEAKEAKEAKLESQVASPARVRISIG